MDGSCVADAQARGITVQQNKNGPLPKRAAPVSQPKLLFLRH